MISEDWLVESSTVNSIAGEMGDASGKTAAMALAVVEKRPQRPGGCVGGILFQLFDWNRKFAKKKLFSKKLLPPGKSHKIILQFLIFFWDSCNVFCLLITLDIMLNFC